MSDSTQQYILKKPIAIDVEKVFNGQVYELPFRQWGMKNGHACISEETFDELFQLLDIPAIEKQLRDIVEKNHCGKPSSIEWIEAVRQEGLAETAKELLAVFGLEKEESHE